MHSDKKLSIANLSLSLIIPFVSAIFILMFIIFLSIYTANSINRHEQEKSKKIVSNLISLEKNHLGHIAHEYSYWNEAITKIIIDRDLFWSDDNLKDNLPHLYNVDYIFVLDEHHQLIYHSFEEESKDSYPEILDSNEVKNLISSVSIFEEEPTYTTTYMIINGTLNFVAVSPFVAYEPTHLDIEKIYGTLILTKEINSEFITEFSEKYELDKLSLITTFNDNDVKTKNTITKPLFTSNNTLLGKLEWMHEDVGQQFLHKFIPWTMIILFILFFLSIFFYRKLKILSKYTFNQMLKNEELNYLAHFDHLTNLPNRTLFLDRASNQIKNCQRNNTISAIIYIDLDDLKKVNDTSGHDVGDLYLIQAANKMTASVRSNDTVSRIGGDEFCILLNEPESITNINKIVDKLLKTLNEPVETQGTTLSVKASIGIVVLPSDGVDLKDLMKYADDAMYKSKALGRNRYTFHSK